MPQRLRLTAAAPDPDATSVASVPVGGVDVELVWSARCAATWAFAPGTTAWRCTPCI
ncbi:hypothetical protein ACPC54_37905 [Kitasatospora sp. NPDC094028]